MEVHDKLAIVLTIYLFFTCGKRSQVVFQNMLPGILTFIRKENKNPELIKKANSGFL